jgi:CrcB protein
LPVDPAAGATDERQRKMRALALYAAIGVGSAIGSVGRWLASVALHASGAAFPWGTLFVNVTGSFAIGWYAAGLAAAQARHAEEVRRAFVLVGLCGGYTTFSIFSLETLTLLQAGRVTAAAANIGLSVTGWLIAVWAGWASARAWKARAEAVD